MCTVPFEIQQDRLQNIEELECKPKTNCMFESRFFPSPRRVAALRIAAGLIWLWRTQIWTCGTLKLELDWKRRSSPNRSLVTASKRRSQDLAWLAGLSYEADCEVSRSASDDCTWFGLALTSASQRGGQELTVLTHNMLLTSGQEY
jgi:hypothetical protein